MKLAATITRFLQADMQAELRGIEGVLYLNDGGWVESCSALVEHAEWRRGRR